MLRVLRNIFRRRLRAALTISGIAIGVLTLVVMGAMSEKITVMMDVALDYYQDKVMVTKTSGANFSTAPMSRSVVTELERVPGVADAACSILTAFDADAGAMSATNMKALGATDLREVPYEGPMKLVAGRNITAHDRKVCVVGADVVDSLGAYVGGTVEIRDEPYKVVGLMEKTLTAPDSMVYVPMPDAQQAVFDTLPPARRRMTRKDDLVTQIAVYPESGVRPAALAKRIQRRFGELSAVGPEEFEQQAVATMSIFSAVVLAIAVTSLIVGGLSVVNTMSMAVSERTREIGMRKAIGASNGQILRQFLAESATVGLLAGMIGVALGSLAVAVLNATLGGVGLYLFMLTPRLLLGSLGFAVVLGGLSGLYPACHAASLPPVAALRQV